MRKQQLQRMKKRRLQQKSSSTWRWEETLKFQRIWSLRRLACLSSRVKFFGNLVWTKFASSIHTHHTKQSTGSKVAREVAAVQTGCSKEGPLVSILCLLLFTGFYHKVIICSMPFIPGGNNGEAHRGTGHRGHVDGPLHVFLHEWAQRWKASSLHFLKLWLLATISQEVLWLLVSRKMLHGGEEPYSTSLLAHVFDSKKASEAASSPHLRQPPLKDNRLNKLLNSIVLLGYYL